MRDRLVPARHALELAASLPACAAHLDPRAATSSLPGASATSSRRSRDAPGRRRRRHVEAACTPIERPDEPAVAAALAERSCWRRVFETELAALASLDR
jgi:hypothetical protein